MSNLPPDLITFLIMLATGGSATGVLVSHLLEFLWLIFPSISSTAKQIIVVLVTAGIVAGAMALLSQPGLLTTLQPLYAAIVAILSALTVGASTLGSAMLYHGYRERNEMLVTQTSKPK